MTCKLLQQVITQEASQLVEYLVVGRGASKRASKRAAVRYRYCLLVTVGLIYACTYRGERGADVTCICKFLVGTLLLRCNVNKSAGGSALP